jgi:hypothetical protein
MSFSTTPLDHNVFAKYSYTRAGQIVADLVEHYLAADGYTAPHEHLALGPSLAEVVFNYITVREALDRITELTGIAWSVTPDRQVRYGTPVSLV